ncbi:MAG: arsenate reductase family protein [Thermonemataceae bacterium]
MHSDKRELTLWYNSDQPFDVQVVARVQDVAPYVQARDIRKDIPTATQIAYLAKQLNRPVADFIKKAPEEKTVIENDHDVLQLLVENPEMIDTPFGFRGDHYAMITSFGDIEKLRDYKGISENPNVNL